MKAKRIISLVSVVLLVGLITTVIILFNTRPGISLAEPEIKKLAVNPWNSNLSEIDRYTEGDVQYIDISQLYTVDSNDAVTVLNPTAIVNSNTVIKINNGLELYYFTVLCNDLTYKANYLTYHYVLGQDIDYTDASRYYKMAKYIGWDVPFTGIFDGQGFVVENLFYEKIISEEPVDNSISYNGNYPGLEYLALFSAIGTNGKVCNVGFENINMIQSEMFGEMVYSSSIIGENNGTVDHVYVQDLRDNEAGLSTEGGFVVSGFASINNGTISNCYVAIDKIISASIYDTDTEIRFPVVAINNGTITNVFYDKSVLSDSHTALDGVVGLTTAEFTSLERYPYFVQSPTNSGELVHNGWFSKATYEAAYTPYISDNYPTLKGFTTTTIDNAIYFQIDDATDFLYFSQVIDRYDPFRQARYILTNTIDMKQISTGAYKLSNSIFRGVLNGGTASGDYQFVNKKGRNSLFNSIINLEITEGISYSGYRCYGLFGALAGTVENINIAININPTALGANLETNLLGLVCGLQEGGMIKAVSVIGNISLDEIGGVGSSYVGGLVGYTTSGSILDSVTTGAIDGGVQTIVNNTPSMIGGIVGRVNHSSSSGSLIQNCLNTMSIDAIRYTTTFPNEQYIGGVVGYAEFAQALQLENDGVISVSNNTYSYGKKYVGGVVGLVTDALHEIGMFLNNSDLDVVINTLDFYNYSCKPIISGCANVISTNKLKLSSFANRGLLNITSVLTGYEAEEVRNSNTTNYLNIKLSGVLYSENTNLDITGLYNFKQKYVYNGNEKELIDLGPQEINFSIIDRFAPCYTANNSSSNIVVNLKQSYNYQTINYKTTAVVKFYNLYLSGNCTGGYVNYDNIRNEGDINVHFSHSADTALNQYHGTLNDYKKLKVFGCFEMVNGSNTYYRTAKNNYNGGDITITLNDRLDVRYCVYASGICYKVESGENYYNEKGIDRTKIMIDANVDGMLHNTINAGNISLFGDHGDYSIYGVCRLSGIMSIASSLITSCFNLGDVYNLNSILPNGTEKGRYAASGEFEVETGGIAFCTDGEYATIRDSANNGNIYSINTSNSNTGYTWSNAAGIVVRNDRIENGTQTTNRQTYQKIQFSINYGNIYAYNENEITGFSDVTYNPWNETQCKAAGFSCIGVLSIVNVINYGNVYSTRAAGGMYGVIFTNKFTLSVENPVYIANAINYGIVGRLILDGSTIPDKTNNATIATNALNYNIEPSGNSYPPYGALIGIIHGRSNSNIYDTFNRITVSYLINFNDRVNIIGGRYNFPTSATGTNLTAIQNMVRYMATTKADDTSPFPFNYGNNAGIKSYSKDTAEPNPNAADQYSALRNGGIFNENFALRNPALIDNTITTNQYIADYIQFIPYSKVNDYLVDKIGLTDAIYSSALDTILNDQSARELMLEYYCSKQQNLDTVYNNLITEQRENDYFYNNNSYINELKSILVGNILSLSDENAYQLLTTLLDINQEYNANIFQNTNKTEFIAMIKEMFDTASNDDANFANQWQQYVLNNPDYLNSYSSLLSDYIKGLTDEEVARVYDLLVNNSPIVNDGYNKEPIAINREQLIYDIIDWLNLNDPIGLENVVSNLGFDSSPSADIKELVNSGEMTKQQLVDYMSQAIPGAIDSVINNWVAQTDPTKSYYDLYLDSLSDKEVNELWIDLRTNKADEVNFAFYEGAVGGSTNRYLYIKADATQHVVAFNPTTKAIEADGNTEYTAPTRPNTSEDVYAGTNINNVSGNYQRTFTNVGSGGGYQLNSNGVFYGRDNDTSRSYDISSGTSYIIFTRTQSTVGWTRYYTYTYSTHGTHYKFQGGANFATTTFMSDGYNWTPATKIKLLKTVPHYLNLKEYAASALDVDFILSALTVDQITTLYDYIFALPEYSDLVGIGTLFALLDYANANVTQFQNFLKQFNIAVTDNALQELIITYLISSGTASNIQSAIPDDLANFYNVQGIMSQIFDLLLEQNQNAIIQFLQTNGALDSKALINKMLESSGNVQVVADAMANIVDSASNRVLLNDLAKTYIIKKTMSHADFIDDFVILMTSVGINFNNPDSQAEIANIVSKIPSFDPNTFIDNSGIYALASAAGIMNGEFLPDNIRLIQLDEYVKQGDAEVIDATWRGGNEQNSDTYTKDDGTINTDCVNYKVYYEMKQLKKSIATTVFRIGLVDDVNSPTFTLNNNVNPYTDASGAEIYDYDLDNSIITFYISINELNELLDDGITTLYINTDERSYDLANLASFKEPIAGISLSEKQVGDVFTSNFTVQAEDVTVTTEYQIRLIVIGEKGLALNTASVNNTNTTITRQASSTVNGYLNTAVNATSRTFTLNYTTSNLPFATDFSSKIKIYSTNLTATPTFNAQYDFEAIKDQQIHGFELSNALVNNALVQNATYNNGAWGDGTLSIAINLADTVKTGYYLFELQITQKTKSYVVIYKAPSNLKYVLSLDYEGSYFANDDLANNNQTSPSETLFGSELSNVTIVDGKPAYLDSLQLSALATVTNVTTPTYANGVWSIVLTVEAEDGTTANFTHYIKEKAVDPAIQIVYRDGGVIQRGNNQYFTFEKYESPAYIIGYDLSTISCDVQDFSFLINGSPASDYQDQLSIEYVEGTGFLVAFYDNALAQEYVITMVYKAGTAWETSFAFAHITKNKNEHSYLENITFTTETILSSLDTIGDVSLIDVESYNILRASTDREIVCLPSGIYYNIYDEDTNKQDLFYFIGLVSKTMLSDYSPNMTLPEDASVYLMAELNGTLYRTVPYIAADGTETVALVDETMTNVVMVDNILVTGVSLNADQGFTYNNVNYTISPLAGKTSIQVNGETRENYSLKENFSEGDGINFTYKLYRVYAEAYYSGSDYFTDYQISVQDVTNNVRFNITILQDTGIDLIAYNHAYLTFTNYQEDTTGTYYVNNKMSMFAYYVAGVSKLTHNTFATNSAGQYHIHLDLPDDYTFKYRAWGGSLSNQTGYVEGDTILDIESRVVTQVINVEIVIIEKTAPDEWGQTTKEDVKTIIEKMENNG